MYHEQTGVVFYCSRQKKDNKNQEEDQEEIKDKIEGRFIKNYQPCEPWTRKYLKTKFFSQDVYPCNMAET